MLAATGFAALTIAATWPLVRHLGSSLPSDLGDPLFVSWVMAWVARHLTAVIGGDLGAFARMWDAPIFAPDPTTLAYSEHFVAQALATLPVRWLGGSPIAAYNTAFLASFWLSALGAYLFVRLLTGRWEAALVAGAIYGFNVYRLISLSHLHTLSSQWPPFVMAGVLVFARTGSRPALAGAGVAFVALALSSAYYLAYFTPLVVAFGLAALAWGTAWRTRTGAIALVLVGLGVFAVVAPFLAPYLEVRSALGMARLRSEVEMMSLTVDAYQAARWHLMPMLVLAAASLLAWRPDVRPLRWMAAGFALAALVAFWLSLGPTPRWHGATIGIPGLYGLLMDHVPGMSGLRAASRLAMVLMLALAVLAGLGVAALSQVAPRWARGMAIVAVAVHLTIYWSAPFPRDVPVGTGTLRPVPAYLDPNAPEPAIYAALRTEDPGAIVAELPFGEPAYDLHYMFAGRHTAQRRINGYSGIYPGSFRARLPALQTPWTAPAAAWAALAPASLVVVHGDAWEPAQAELVHQWLVDRGAQPLATADGATVWRLPDPP